MQFKTTLPAALLLLAAAACPASAASWPPDGKTIAEHGIPPAIPACVSCHGATFAGDPATGAPSLRGKSAADLMDDLYAEAGNAKAHSKMAAIARHLGMAERAAVTAFIARRAHGRD